MIVIFAFMMVIFVAFMMVIFAFIMIIFTCMMGIFAFIMVIFSCMFVQEMRKPFFKLIFVFYFKITHSVNRFQSV